MASETLRRLCEDAWEHPNVQAWAHVVREGESSQSDDKAYRMQVGGKLLRSLADHPRERVWVERLKVWSTAAGAYQNIAGTWDEAASALGLTDFGPRSQDLAMVFLTRRRGALDDVIAGRLDEVIRKCRLEWASLPGDAYGQGGIDMERARRTFAAWGGTLADQQDAPAPDGPAAASAGAPADGGAPVAGAPNMPDLGEGDRPVVAPIIAAVGTELLVPLAKSIWSALSPLAADKIEREIGRHTDRPEVARDLAQATVSAVQTLTGLADPVRATAAALDKPEVLAKVEASVLEDLERLAPLLERMHAMDRQDRQDTEASFAAAAARPNPQDQFLTRAIVWLLATIIVGSLVLFGVLAAIGVSDTVLMAVFGILNAATLLAVAKFGTRYDHAYGSSAGSANKDAVRDAALTQIARKGAAR